MTFRPPKKPPTFADLKAILSQSKNTDGALYQTVEEIIDRLGQFKTSTEAKAQNITTTVENTGTIINNITQIINTIITTNETATYLTKNDEIAQLPNSIQVLAGAGISFDDTVPNKRTINSTASGMNLDYLGDYVAGTYNDGDIVVGADGVAYMCVVDGTTTPPEPWPMPTAGGGSGGSGGAPVNATYWVVSPHAELTNERALSSLANGYVKSTGGEPSTIAVIPLSEGGTGATNAPNARTNLGLGTIAVQNADNVAITGGTIGGSTNISTTGAIFTSGTVTAITSVATGRVEINAIFPFLMYQETNQPANAKLYRVSEFGGDFYFQALNDAFGVQSQISFSRTGVITGNGSGLTNLNASNLATGLAAPARLGSGTANSTTFLRGDSVWATPPTTEAFPSGLIVISLFPCPPGWTRVIWDGSFLRVGPTPGAVGGSPDHAHGLGSLQVPDHAHGAGSYVAANHDHGGSVTVNTTISGTTGDGGSHSHNVNASGAAVTGVPNQGPNTADAGGSFQTPISSHTHNVNIDVAGSTSNEGNHNHSFSGSGSGVGTIGANQPAVSGVSAGAGALALTGGMAAANHLPPYIDIFLCQKN